MIIALKDTNHYITLTHELYVEGIGMVKYKKFLTMDNVLIDRFLQFDYNEMTRQEEEDLMDACDKVIESVIRL